MASQATAAAPEPAVASKDRPAFLAPMVWGLTGVELASAGAMIAVGAALRTIAAFKTGALVDELTYQYLGAYTCNHGFPDLRPVLGKAPEPFLYHPPFFFYLLAGWFRLWGNDGLYTARMFSVVISIVMLALLFLLVRRAFGSRAALLALFLAALDPWLILINQGVYIENSLMLIVLAAIWLYWNANRQEYGDRRRYLLSYGLAGLALGAAVAYKQIGGYVLLAVVINFLLTRRRHPKGHAVLAA